MHLIHELVTYETIEIIVTEASYQGSVTKCELWIVNGHWIVLCSQRAKCRGCAEGQSARAWVDKHNLT
jgi:hypothetical protein